MIIAVNTRLQHKQQPEGYAQYLFELLQHLTEQYPQHQYIFFFDKAPPSNLVFQKNVLPVVAGPDTRNSLRMQYWFNYKIPALLRKHKADVFVSMEGICSLRTRKPQCLLFTDLEFLQSASVKTKSNTRFLKKFTPSFLLKAKSIATVSAFNATTLANRYALPKDEIAVISPGVSPLFRILNWEEAESVKNRYSDGKAYFLYSGRVNGEANLVNLLKAFSIFKKRQRSNMLMLLAGEPDEKFKKELSTYKLRNEVKLLEKLTKEQLAAVTGAAYALVHPASYTDLPLSALQALHCKVPVIISNMGAMPSLLENAALFTDPGNINELAENMMLVFKDEDRAKELTAAGLALQGRFQWDKSAAALMQAIQKAVES